MYLIFLTALYLLCELCWREMAVDCPSKLKHQIQSNDAFQLLQVKHRQHIDMSSLQQGTIISTVRMRPNRAQDMLGGNLGLSL